MWRRVGVFARARGARERGTEEGVAAQTRANYNTPRN
jgi:hypothetical protein